MGITKNVKVPAVPEVAVYEGTCDKCSKILQPEALCGGSNMQDSLDVILNGGYGEYIDFCEGPARLVLCETCADLLLEFLGYSKKEIYTQFT